MILLLKQSIKSLENLQHLHKKKFLKYLIGFPLYYKKNHHLERKNNNLRLNTREQNQK